MSMFIVLMTGRKSVSCESPLGIPIKSAEYKIISTFLTICYKINLSITAATISNERFIYYLPLNVTRNTTNFDTLDWV